MACLSDGAAPPGILQPQIALQNFRLAQIKRRKKSDGNGPSPERPEQRAPVIREKAI